MIETQTLTVTEPKPRRHSTRTRYNQHQLTVFKTRLDELRSEWENNRQRLLLGHQPPTGLRAWIWVFLPGTLGLWSVWIFQTTGVTERLFLALGATLLIAVAAFFITSRWIRYRHAERIYRHGREKIRIEDCPASPGPSCRKVCF